MSNMLDKSIPHKKILMKRPKGTPIPEHKLAPGFSFHDYEPGNEADWCRIETSVGEFEHEDKAWEYFKGEFAPYPEELKRRMIFVRDPRGELVATSTAWWNDKGERKVPILHWVAVAPSAQGKGIGKAIVSEAIKRKVALEGDEDLYLSTQTWSYKAINIYRQAGFEFLTRETYGVYKNEYEEAIKIIEGKLRL